MPQDPKLQADRYISRGGGSPNPTSTEVAEDIVKVGAFLAWQEEHAMRGGYRPGECFDAFCRLVNVDRAVLRKIVRPDG